MSLEASGLPADEKLQRAIAPLKELYRDSWEQTFGPAFIEPALLLARSGAESPVDMLCAYFLFRYIDLRADKAPVHAFYFPAEERAAVMATFRRDFGEKIYAELEELLHLPSGIPDAADLRNVPLSAKRYTLALFCFLIPHWSDRTFNGSFFYDAATGASGKVPPSAMELQHRTEWCARAQAALDACVGTNAFLETRLRGEITMARALLEQAWESPFWPPARRTFGPPAFLEQTSAPAPARPR